MKPSSVPKRGTHSKSWEGPLRWPRVTSTQPAYSGLVFPGSEPEKPDLSSLVMDSTIPQELRERILLEVETSHRANLERNKAMDTKFWALYSAAAGVVNIVSEAVR